MVSSSISPMSDPSTAAAAVMADPDPNPRVDISRHTRYFLRCLKTYLPTAYQSNDSNRMSLAFFTLSALDLLGTLEPNTTLEQRNDYTSWIYTLQHPNGGFRAFPGTDLGPEHTTPENAHWDPANLPATYFALSSLLVLGDDLTRVKRKETLTWLAKLQRANGSFGETLGDGEVVHGGMDSRFGYCGAAVRYILRGSEHEGEPVDGVEDVRVEDFVKCVKAAETYDGGISEAPYHEAHAGFTFCAVAALSLMGRLSTTKNALKTPDFSSSSTRSTGPSNPAHLLHWLLSRQTATITPEGCELDDESDDDLPSPKATAAAAAAQADVGQSKLAQQDILATTSTKGSAPGDDHYCLEPTTTVHGSSAELQYTGFNGRCNKIADTCYAFWVGATLDILEYPSLTNRISLRRYLLEKTAHLTLGGFGKLAGDLPDIYHSSLGLAALSLTGDEDLKSLDATMCISKEARGHLRLIWQRWGVPGEPI